MKKIILTLFTGGSIMHASSQMSIATINGAMFGNTASSYFPSMLGNDFDKWQIEMGTFALGGSSGVPFGTVKQFAFDSYITDDEMKYYFGQLDGRNIISGRLDAQLFSLAMKFPLNEINSMAASFAIRDRVATDLFFNRNFVDLLLNGNAQFAGVNTDLGIPGINSNYYREFAAGTSFLFHDVDFNSGTLNNTKLQVGGRMKVLTGLAMTDMPNSSAMLYTDTSGQYIDLAIDQQLHYAGIEAKSSSFGIPTSVTTGSFSALKATGMGFAMDFGISYSCNKVHNMMIGITDIGFLTYRNVSSTSIQGDYHFEGIEVDNILTDLVDDSIGGVDNYYEIESSADGSYSVPLPARINLQYEYTIDQSAISGFFNKGVAFGTYSRSLHNTETTVGSGFITAGYALWMKNFAVVGANISIGGYESIGLGTFMAAKLAAFKIGVGTSDILTLFTTDSHHGGSVTANIGVSF